ncbi:MAG: hypothetical protein AAB641_02130 [Patescibacteria group bacterium]
MDQDKLKKYMTFRREGNPISPMKVFEVNGNYIISVYKGSISEFDILIKYRQKHGNKWSRIRTPKHIHWAVDILIKLYEDREKTQEFLDFLLKIWEEIKSVKNSEAQKEALDIVFLLKDSQELINKYEELSSKGEYSVKFLILLAKLLMIQEKTNLETAYMFKRLLTALREGGDIFKIVSTATHVGR